MTWENRFKSMMAYFGWEARDISKMTGASIPSVYKAMSQKAGWAVKLAVLVWEKMLKKIDEK